MSSWNRVSSTQSTATSKTFSTKTGDGNSNHHKSEGYKYEVSGCKQILEKIF